MNLSDLLAKHPTPWTAEPCGVTGCSCRFIEDADGHLIIQIGHKMDDESPIVAPLFAAAPEMLKFLEVILGYSEDDDTVTIKRIREIIVNWCGEFKPDIYAMISRAVIHNQSVAETRKDAPTA